MSYSESYPPEILDPPDEEPAEGDDDENTEEVPAVVPDEDVPA